MQKIFAENKTGRLIYSQAYNQTPLLLQLGAVIISAVLVGGICMLGLLPLTALIIFLVVATLVILFENIYRLIIFTGIALLSCVFVEPSPSDVIIAALIPLGIISGEFRSRSMGHTTLAVVLMFLYFIFSLCGIAAADDLFSALRYYMITAYLFIMALFICIYAGNENITALLRAYILATFISFAAGLAGFLGLFQDILMADPYRIKGLFKDPNVFGPFFVPSIILLIDDIGRKRIFKTRRWLHIAGILLLSLGVIFSYSRAAWINLAFSIAVYTALNLKTINPSKLIRIIIASTTILAMITCIMLTTQLHNNKIVSFIQERARLQEYDRERFSTQQGGLKLILMHPLGVGPGQFESNIDDITGLRLSSHSLYIRTASENGILGFAAFIFSLFFIFYQLYNIHLSQKRVQLIKGLSPSPAIVTAGISPAAVLAVLSGLLVNSIVVDTLHWRHFWFFIGIALYCIKESWKKVQTDE